MSNKKDYKDTLNLPQTDFPMKADLPKREPVFLKTWQEMDIYRLIQGKLKGRTKYILHDGPPYANGDIHIGHALNKTLKDIVTKYKTMQGNNSAFVPGWDCHGLPIEHQLFRELKINKSQISQIEFRKKAYAYAMNYVYSQKEQFKRLGVFGDWENPYLTLSHEYEESIVNSFGELVKKGYIYRGLKPVNWCYICETALAEAEVEYENHTSPSIYVKFKLGEHKDYPQDSFLVIWTTTPWTLVANVAVAVHPNFTYAYLNTEKGNLVILKDLLNHILEQIGVSKHNIIKEVKGADLEGLTYTHPLGLRKGRVVLADYVSKEDGTGLVHTAPGHGNEDYLTGIKYKLDIIMPVDAKGRFDASTGEFQNMNVYDANKVIIRKLQNIGALLFNSDVVHSYPHCWRCRSPIIFRATKQWFLNLEHKDSNTPKPLRERLLDAIEEVTWIPAAGKERISAMVKERPDWYLSRQRYWGVPIPALVCNQCHEEFLEPKVIDKFAHFVKIEGSDVWFEKELKDFLSEGLRCPYCKGTNFSKGTDILDVWFDSGVSHQAVLKKREELGGIPCALYLEGSDQHRGWFQSSLIPSICIDNKAPFEAVLTHGFVVDAEGRKMSKSLGNVISPFEIIEKYGADILRLWVASSDYNEDIRISSEIISRLTEAYRKIRNTARFILSNLYDFNPDIDKVNYIDLRRIDKWVLYRLEWILDFVTGAYGREAGPNFEFYKAYQGIYDFCNGDLSMYYLDMVKGRLYTYAGDSLERRAVQTTIYEVLNVLTRIMAPLLVFTAEEIWQHMPKEKKDSLCKSIHLLDWPAVNTAFAQQDVAPERKIDKELSTIMDLIPDVSKVLELKRSTGIIGSSFDAKINMLTKDEFCYKYLESLKSELCEIFKVSQIEIIKKEDLDADLFLSSKYPNIAIQVLRCDGVKCQRCWNYSLSVAREDESLCERCLSIVRGR